MERWQRNWIHEIEITAQETGQFLEEMAAVVEAVAVEIDQAIAELVEPLVEICLGVEAAIDDAAQPFAQTVQPVVQDHPPCVGCRHYHGQAYGGNLLICAMHPYRYEAETCPDWQSTWELS